MREVGMKIPSRVAPQEVTSCPCKELFSCGRQGDFFYLEYSAEQSV